MSKSGQKRVSVWVQRFVSRPYGLQWIDPASGKRKTKSAGTYDRRDADRKAKELEYELNHGLAELGGRMPWRAFRDAYEAEHVNQLRERSQEAIRTALDHFERFKPRITVNDISVRTVAEFARYLRILPQRAQKIGLAPKSIKSYLVSLHGALAWGQRQEFIRTVPAFPEIKVPKRKPQATPAEVFERIIAAERSPEWRGILYAAWYAGLRIEECLRTRWAESFEHPWIDLERRRIVFPAAGQKNNEDDWLPIHRVLFEVLDALPRTSVKVFPVGCDRPAASKHFSRLFRKLGVRTTFHGLRRGFITRLAKDPNVTPAMLKRLARHASIQTTMQFYVDMEDEIADAIERIT